MPWTGSTCHTFSGAEEVLSALIWPSGTFGKCDWDSVLAPTWLNATWMSEACVTLVFDTFFLYKSYIWPSSGCKYNVSDFDRKSCNYMCTVPKNTSIQDQFCYHFAVFVCTVKSVEGRRRQLLSKVVSTSKLPRASMITRHPTMKMATRQTTGGKRERGQRCETLKKIFPASTFPRWLQRKLERFAAST